jgi:hypothetical protein
LPHAAWVVSARRPTMRHTAIAALAVAAMPLLVALLLAMSPGQVTYAQAGGVMAAVVPAGAAGVGSQFDVNINIVEAPAGWGAWQAYLVWDDSKLTYVFDAGDPNSVTPGIAYTGLGGTTLDATPSEVDLDTDTVTDGVQFGAGRASGTSKATGTVARVTLQCNAAGVAVLHLVSYAEHHAFPTTLIGGDGSYSQVVDGMVACMSDTTTDNDGDGCSWTQEAFGAPSPYPGSTCASVDSCYSDFAGYDVFDVPVPANADPEANGVKDGAVTMSDVLAVLRYVFTKEGRGPVNGVDYDADKNGDTIKDGRDYDRSSGPGPNPPWAAGPPDGAVSMDDIMVILPQVGLSCAGPP